MNALHWAAEHPVPVAVGVFAVGALLLLMNSGGGGGQSSGGDMAAFYSAEASQANANAQLSATQSTNATALGIASLQAQTSQANTKTSADAAVAVNQSNNNLSAYEAYKQIRLATQQSAFAYQAGVNGDNVANLSGAFANINHGLTFGSAA